MIDNNFLENITTSEFSEYLIKLNKKLEKKSKLLKN